MIGGRNALTETQRAYLIDAARGLSAKQSAHRRNVCEDTVNQGRNRARLVLDAVNITHAVAIAIAASDISIFEIFAETD